MAQRLRQAGLTGTKAVSPFDAKYDWPANIPKGFSEVESVFVPGAVVHTRLDGDHLDFDYTNAQGMIRDVLMRHGIGTSYGRVPIIRAQAWAKISDVVGIYETLLTKRGLREAEKGGKPERHVVAYFQFHPKVLLSVVDQLHAAEDKWEKEEIGDFRHSKSCTKAEESDDQDIIVMKGAARHVGV
jgi:hypothetical protein